MWNMITLKTRPDKGVKVAVARVEGGRAVWVTIGYITSGNVWSVKRVPDMTYTNSIPTHYAILPS